MDTDEHGFPEKTLTRIPRIYANSNPAIPFAAISEIRVCSASVFIRVHPWLNCRCGVCGLTQSGHGKRADFVLNLPPTADTNRHRFFAHRCPQMQESRCKHRRIRVSRLAGWRSERQLWAMTKTLKLPTQVLLSAPTFLEFPKH